MTVNELEELLYTTTESEKYHLAHPDVLSIRYQKIAKTTYNSEEIYLFRCEDLLQNHNICINKDSRYTSIPLHLHTIIEFNYVYRGAITHVINGEEIHLNTGDVLILDTNTPHEVRYIGEDDINMDIVMRKCFFTTHFLSNLSSQGIVAQFISHILSDQTNSKHYLIFHTENDLLLRTYIQQLMCEYYELQYRRSEIIDAYMVIIFTHLATLFQKNTLNRYSLNKMNLTIKILQYLEDNFKTATLLTTAETFGFSTAYLSTYLKKKTGKTFTELIMAQKMSQACFQLTNTDLPIYEIANGIGYENLGFFYKKFKRYYGMNPQEYRNRTRNGI
ncbi:AraC family transcriptional regulator [Candidatus Merdisoma sp. JLR.KK006]|uniref:AraC family transcriptional regulator n=1 Tax=Candidatus Merdisoma sp. JLR.KK006 TaxID=3112626 RepID=UPI002FF0BD3E